MESNCHFLLVDAVLEFQCSNSQLLPSLIFVIISSLYIWFYVDKFSRYILVKCGFWRCFSFWFTSIDIFSSESS